MVPSEHREAVDAMPPDDWLTISDAELAERSRRLAEHEVPLASTTARDRSDTAADGLPEAPDYPPLAPVTSKLDCAIRLGQSLTPFDRMRLIAKLWSTLTPRQRAKLVSIQFDGIGGPVGSLSGLKQSAVVKTIWRFLLDPSNTTGLYSAPRRFDLATIFVVISAYSILFAGLSLADRWMVLELQPQLTLIVGGLVTIVAIAQAWNFGEANPRGVSIIVGAIAYTILYSCVAWPVTPGTIPGIFFFMIAVVCNGILGGALFGYAAGVFVGGMFLVADALRDKLSANPTHVDPVPEDDEFNAAHETTTNGRSED